MKYSLITCLFIIYTYTFICLFFLLEYEIKIRDSENASQNFENA